MTNLPARIAPTRWAGALAAVLAAAAMVGTTATPASAATQCQAFAAITMGKYWINNNLWGQSSGSGTQCVTDTFSSGQTIGWNTNWSWTGQQNQVKSYSSAVLGWHWGWKTQGTELPVQLSAGRDVVTDWRFRVSGSGTMNVAYDLWLHSIPNPDWPDNPTDEVMIWLHRSGGAGPLGTFQGTVQLAGASWDLYRGNIGWNVFSFVRTSNTASVSLHLQDFLNNLVNRGWMSTSKYLSSIQAGTEVFVGTGRLDTDSYLADIR